MSHEPERQFTTVADLFSSRRRVLPDVPDNDEAEFVSPPFPVIFLTVTKVIVSAIIVLTVLTILVLFAALLIDQFIYSFTD